MATAKRNTAVIKFAIIAVCVIVSILSLLAIIFCAEVAGNKKKNTEYSQLSALDREMIDKVNAYFAGKPDVEFTSKVAFVKNGGLTRGRAYVFNVDLTMKKYNYGLNGGAYAAEIQLPKEYRENLPTMYRTCKYAPSFGSYFFPKDYEYIRLNSEDIYVISYSEDSLRDGTFEAMLDRMIGK